MTVPLNLLTLIYTLNSPMRTFVGLVSHDGHKYSSKTKAINPISINFLDLSNKSKRPQCKAVDIKRDQVD